MNQEQIQTVLQNALQKFPYTRNYKLGVSGVGLEFVLKGIVRTYFHKQMAQEEMTRLLKITGKDFILTNEIKVQSNHFDN